MGPRASLDILENTKIRFSCQGMYPFRPAVPTSVCYLYTYKLLEPNILLFA